MKLNCVVIDDEPLARECMEGYIREVDFLQLRGSGNNPLELNRIMAQHQVDLVLLDIHMPMMNGIEFLKIAPVRPMVIITSAYPQYALEGYQLDVLDYLVKPIVFSRFYKAAAKALDYARLVQTGNLSQAANHGGNHAENQSGNHSTKQSGKDSETQAAAQPANQPLQEPADNFFFIKSDYRYEKIFFDEILFIEAVQNYVSIQTVNGKFMTLLSLKSIEEKLDPAKFLRVHKSFVIAADKIKAIGNNEIVIDTHHIPISRSYRDHVMARLVDGRLWKR